MTVRTTKTLSIIVWAIVWWSGAMLWTPAPAQASGLSDLTGVHIDIPAETFSLSQPHPEHLPQIIKNLPEDVKETFLNPFGPQLAFLIRQARAQASGSAQPMPDALRQELSSFFPSDILGTALFTTQQRAGISIATGTLEVNGNIAAMTVDNIIVFRDDQASQDPIIWAHELMHVSQYRNMGIDGFAAVYAGPGAQKLENEAYSWQDHVAAALPLIWANAAAPVPQSWQEESSPQGFAPPTWQQFHQAAIQVIPPSSCALWSQADNNSMIVQNHCPVGIVVKEVFLNGQPLNCVGVECNVPANGASRISGSPGQLTNMTFVFLYPPGF